MCSMNCAGAGCLKRRSIQKRRMIIILLFPAALILTGNAASTKRPRGSGRAVGQSQRRLPGVDPRVRGFTGLVPPTLGYLAPVKAEHRPALMAAFGIPEEVEPGRIIAPHKVEAVHITLLRPDGSGRHQLCRTIAKE